jgi:cell division protein FtsA
LVGNRNQTDNFLKPLQDIGLESPKPFFSGLCSAIPTVSDDEHEKGVVFIDMGAGTTEYAFLRRPSVLLAGVLPIGCDHMANDLSIALGLPFSPICRDLVLRDLSSVSEAFIKLPGERSNRQVPKDTVSQAIEMRMRETFEIVRGKFDDAGLLGKAGAGVVFTGGGSMLPRAPEILRSVFDMPVRVAGVELPDNVSGATAGFNSPRCSTLLGVLIFGASTVSGASVLTKFDHGINSMLRKAWKHFTGAFKF